MSPARPNRKTVVLISALLAVITFLLYSPSLRHEFVNFDDDEYIINNPHIQHGLNWGMVKWAFTSVYASNWHPVTWLSHMADYSRFKQSAKAHHLMSVGLHAVNAALLFVLLWNGCDAADQYERCGEKLRAHSVDSNHERMLIISRHWSVPNLLPSGQRLVGLLLG